MPGGVSNYYRTLRSHLDPDKVYLEIGAVPGESGRVRRLLRILGDVVRFHRALAARDFDLVHINPSIDVFSVVRDGIFLLVARLHGTDVLVFYRGWMPVADTLVRERFPRLFRWVYGRARASIVLAAEFRRALLDLGVREPIFIETTVVGDDAFAATEASPRNPLPGSLRILFLSRLDTGKGLPEALDAYALLRATVPGATLDIAGDGPERAWAEREVARRGIAGVRFLGHVGGADKRAAFGAADAYLFTSLAEGMPNSVLEAMAHGLPVVTRPVGGVRDFFVDGTMGYAVDSTDPAEFARRLAQLAADPALRAAMGRHNRDYARSRFAASVVAARLLAIYDSLRPAVAAT